MTNHPFLLLSSLFSLQENTSQTALMYASASRSTDTVKILLAVPVIDINHANVSQQYSYFEFHCYMQPTHYCIPIAFTTALW